MIVENGIEKLKLNFHILAYSYPTHILTHNGISAYGFPITKQHSVTSKSVNRCSFENKYLKTTIPSGEGEYHTVISQSSTEGISLLLCIVSYRLVI